MTTSLYEATPDPVRITESLRDTGYVLNTAVADVVDNSISANATRIDVELVQDPTGRVRFSITDNGEGMDTEGLVNALRYGSDHRDDPASLGKFGLGLKTASTAFARRIRLTSRTGPGEPVVGIWDLDRVAEIGWNVEVTETVLPFDRKTLDEVSGGGAGTVVRWESVDRVIKEYKDPRGSRARTALDKAVKSLSDHLSMVFQRFLDAGDDRVPSVEIRLNGAKLEAWNPFAFGAECLLDDESVVETELGDSKILLRAYVLPRKAEMQAVLGEEAHIEARLFNTYQGIYVYRENRLIHGPDWLGLFIQEPHYTLARVELSFDHKLDEAFQIDLKKSRISLDTSITDYLAKALAAPRREAGIRYRDGERTKLQAVDDKSIHAPSNATIEDKSRTMSKATLQSTDPETGKAEILNAKGRVLVEYVPSTDNRVFLETVNTLDEGLLYRPAYIGQNPGVQISKTHAFYEKVYLPNRQSGATIQALDSLLWALAAAEFKVSDDATLAVFEDIRYDVSRTLRKLVEDLPSPDLEE
ncbi:ATP-binding protein [Arthrobacter sp. YD4]|uniref:ATP-binding protein n=1 Tax=Arthrobacter sp. YD4 TaxID=3058043 RepID=UPI0025B53F94|nr:ATP-binding protein [Arthrobacter sp. YD4]MDN3937545.1 ATP-binding protein [Arthrobacter sp. YD4]